MLFNSITFGVFIIIVFLLYYLIPHRFRWIFLLVTSYAFYCNLNFWYGFILLGATALTYFTARAIDCGAVISESAGDTKLSKDENSNHKNKMLLLGIVPLILILLFFKEAAPIINKLNEMSAAGRLQLSPITLKIVLPAGVSFYFFQSMGYLIDVYKGKIHAEKHFGYYALFVSFFPQLLAGPIGRADKLLPQCKEERHFDYENVTYGIKLMAWGYFKKLVIADTLGAYVDKVYDNCYSYVGLVFIVTTIMFAIQIYCDFSGYSDIAIGCAKLLGINLMTNFKSPYVSCSIREFWSRWHISLSTWFRDYVYIPLGGNRVGKWRNRLNLMITFLVSGLWHGSTVNYIIWGGLHGLLQIIENAIFPVKKNADGSKVPSRFNPLKWLFTFLLLCVTWVFFRAATIKDALWIFQKMFLGAKDVVNYLRICMICLDTEYASLIGIVLAILILVIYDIASVKTDVIKAISKTKFFIRWPVYILLIAIILLFSAKGVATEFIYMQF